MSYYNSIEFESPPDGHTIMVNQSIILKISNFLYSFIGTLIIPIIIYLINKIYHLNINIGNYIQFLIILFLLVYTFLNEFRISKGKINKVLHYTNYLKIIIDKIEIKIDYTEIEKLESLNIDKGIVRFKFNEKSQLYKKFKNGKSNRLKIQNGRVNGITRNKDVIRFYENKILKVK